MATVRKRRWVHKGVEKEAWIVAYTDDKGGRRIKTFVKKKDADAYRVRVEGELALGSHTARGDSISVKEAIREHLLQREGMHRLGDITGNTLKGDRYHLSLVERHLGKEVLSEITDDQVQELADGLRRKYSARTVISAHNALGAVMAMGLRRGWLKRNVVKTGSFRLPKKPKRSAIPSKEDIRTLLSITARRLPNEQYLPFLNRRLILTLGVFAGLRPGEMCGLHWEDICFDKKVISICRSYSRVDGLKAPKSQAGFRDVPLTPPVEDALLALTRHHSLLKRKERVRQIKSEDRHDLQRKRCQRRAREGKLDEMAEMKGYVLQPKEGVPYRASLDHPWRGLMQRAGLCDPQTGRPNFSPHALRHAAVSLLIEAELPAMNLAAMIGHKSVSTTYDIYGHLFPDDTRAASAANTIAGAFYATSAQHGQTSH